MVERLMLTRARATVGVAAIGIALSIGLAPRAKTAALGVPVVSLAVGGRANAHVSLASSGSLVVAAWSAARPEGPTDIFSAVSHDGGRAFSAPVRVNATPGEARVNGEQPPRVALSTAASGRPRMSVIWTAKRANGTVLLTTHSDDLGTTFGRSTVVTGTDVPGNRGWEALGADPHGRVHAVWLDHRRMSAATADRAPAEHKHRHGEGPGATGGGGAPTVKPDGVAMARQSDLYFDTLGDNVEPRAITPGVCYCCKTAIAFGRPNRVFLAWRHVYPGNFRDMAFAASADGGRTFTPPVRVSEDHWMLEGCPDDGPAMGVDAQGRAHIVWPAVVTERGMPTKALFHASTTDGRLFTPRQRIPTEGMANHPQLAIAGDGTLRAAWDESGGGKRTIVLGRGVIGKSGDVTWTRRPLDGEPGVYPMVVATAEGALVAWTAGASSESVIRVARVQ